MDKVRIQFTNYSGHIFYLYKGSDGYWRISSQNGINEAFSNFSKNSMLLKFALEDAFSAQDAKDALIKYGNGVKDAYVLGSV